MVGALAAAVMVLCARALPPATAADPPSAEDVRRAIEEEARNEARAEALRQATLARAAAAEAAAARRAAAAAAAAAAAEAGISVPPPPPTSSPPPRPATAVRGVGSGAPASASAARSDASDAAVRAAERRAAAQAENDEATGQSGGIVGMLKRAVAVEGGADERRGEQQQQPEEQQRRHVQPQQPRQQQQPQGGGCASGGAGRRGAHAEDVEGATSAPAPAASVVPTDEELALADELLGAAAGAGESVRSLLSMDAGFEAVRSDGVGADGAARSAARSLLALSVSGGNTRWVGWENLPQRLDEPRSGPEVRQGRQSGHTHVTLAGGYWEAALINSVVQPANRVRSRRGAGDALGLASSGEGTLSGPYAGINQHDRLGLDKASGALSTAALHRDARCAFSHCRDDLQISLDAYPSLGSVDRVHLKIQPFVVGVTSYSPNRRADNYQYRNIFQIGSVEQSSADATVTTVGTHSLEVGDRVKIESVRGLDRHSINGIEFEVTDVSGTADGDGNDANGLLHATTFTLENVATGAALDSTGMDWDVSSAFVLRQPTPTNAVPNPAHGEHDWSYEEDDLIYIFVTFSEPVVVYGSPRLKLDLGSHFEAGAADHYATYAGGGFGEKKAFWKNNEPNPLKKGEEAYSLANQRRYGEFASSPGLSNDAHTDNSAMEDPLQLFADGVCASSSEGCTSADTSTVGTVFKVRGTHTLSTGDIVIIRGVYGPDADSLNKQFTVGSHVTKWEFSLEPPLDISGLTFYTGRLGGSETSVPPGSGYIAGARYTPGSDHDTPESSAVTIQRVNTGIRCRSHSLEGGGLTDASAHGNHYCTFSSDTYTSTGLAFDGGNTVSSLRRERQFDEERIEQSMDNILAFEYRVQTGARGAGGADGYDQNVGALALTSGQTHLSADLDYTGTDALDLDGGNATIKRACADHYQVSEITAADPAVLTLVSHASPQTSGSVAAMHTLLAGDIIYIAGVGGTDAGTVNGKYTIVSVTGDRITLGVTTCAVPGVSTGYSGSGAVSGASCGVSSPNFSSLSFTVDVTTAYVRRKNVYNNDYSRCKFNDALLTLPKPGGAMLGSHGATQSLSYNKDLVIGRAYVQNVTSDVHDTTYGYNTGYGINTGGDNSAGVPDVIDVKVHFSEAVKASCGADNDQWVFQEHYMGLYYRVCAQIKLVLVTIDDTNGMNDNSTTGLPGEPIFPTGFLYETGSDPPTVLNFRYVVRRNDDTNDLQYLDTHSLYVNEFSGEDSHIRRVADNKLAGIKLPPTERDGARHPSSLAAQKSIKIKATF